jgi:hypothetical protein
MLLLDRFPAAATKEYAASNGDLAVHVFMTSRTNLAMEVLRRLVELFPQGLQTPNKQGLLPARPVVTVA